MDLDGSTARKYNIGYFFSATAPRVSLAPGWPASAEDNIERLKDAGLPVDTKIPKCSNCDGRLKCPHKLAVADAKP